MGALITVPLAGLAATASAEAPADPTIPLVAPADQAPEAAEIGRPPFPGGQRGEFRERGPEHGPRIYRDDPGPRIFKFNRPPSGSAGSS